MINMLKSYNELIENISAKYPVQEIEFSEEFCCHRIKKYIYIFSAMDYVKDYDIDICMEELKKFDEKVCKGLHGANYLVILPRDFPSKDMCTFFNGKSFLHFIFIDRQNQTLIYNKGLNYAGSKIIKKFMDMYEQIYKSNLIEL